jgi:four helix bundle protein
MDSYRSLEAWKKAHAAALLAHRAVPTVSQGKSFALFEQLRRAAVSVEANIVEGYALNTAGLCRRHFRIAVGSAAEAECLVRLAFELSYLERQIAEELERELGETMRLLRGLLRRPLGAPIRRGQS